MAKSMHFDLVDMIFVTQHPFLNFPPFVLHKYQMTRSYRHDSVACVKYDVLHLGS